MVKISLSERHIEACNKLIDINNLKFKNKNEKKKLKIEDVKKVFKQVSENQYSKVLNFLKKQIDDNNKEEQSGGNTPPPNHARSYIRFRSIATLGNELESNNNNSALLIVNNESNTNEELYQQSLGIESNTSLFNGYMGYTPFQIRVIIILIFCVIYGILEEFNGIYVQSNTSQGNDTHPNPVSLPQGGRNKKKRQTKKKKRKRRKTKSKKKLKR